jgi:hypothetical protein
VAGLITGNVISEPIVYLGSLDRANVPFFGLLVQRPA